jgi:hypothetical protein
MEEAREKPKGMILFQEEDDTIAWEKVVCWPVVQGNNISFS